MNARRIDYERLACWEWLPVFREDEVAALLGVSSKQVARYRDAGQLERAPVPPPRRGDGRAPTRGTVLYTGESVRRLLGVQRGGVEHVAVTDAVTAEAGDLLRRARSG